MSLALYSVVRTRVKKKSDKEGKKGNRNIPSQNLKSFLKLIFREEKNENRQGQSIPPKGRTATDLKMRGVLTYIHQALPHATHHTRSTLWIQVIERVRGSSSSGPFAFFA
jgi:hypothetical protein